MNFEIANLILQIEAVQHYVEKTKRIGAEVARQKSEREVYEDELIAACVGE